MKQTITKAVAGLALAAGLFAAAGSANAAMITFTDDPLGDKSNGWSPVNHPDVKLYDTVGSGLRVGIYGSEAIDGKALRVFTNGDQSKLEIRFAYDIRRLSLWFGNDEAARTAPGDLAYLEIFNDGIPVGTTSVVLNRNNIMDQMIKITGEFDMARFSFTNASFVPLTGPGPSGSFGMQENVDNIRYGTVPEPDTLLMIAGGLLGLAAGRRRRTSRI